MKKDPSKKDIITDVQFNDIINSVQSNHNSDPENDSLGDSDENIEEELNLGIQFNQPSKKSNIIDLDEDIKNLLKTGREK